MSDRPTPAEYAEWREAEKKATEGPWEAYHRCSGCEPSQDECIGLGLEVHGPPEASNRGQFARGADAVFIALARTAMPRLLDAVADLEALFDGARSLAEEYHGDRDRAWKMIDVYMDEVEALTRERDEARAEVAGLKTRLAMAEMDKESEFREVLPGAWMRRASDE